jgi:hypothetical protein
LTHKSAGDHLGATFLKQFTTSRQALRFLAGVYIFHDKPKLRRISRIRLSGFVGLMSS